LSRIDAASASVFPLAALAASASHDEAERLQALLDACDRVLFGIERGGELVEAIRTNAQLVPRLTSCRSVVLFAT
jgi:hypothetical protein